MKVILFIVICVFAAFFVFLYPMVMKEKVCYDTSAKTINDLNFFIASRGLSHEDVCSKRSIALMSLEDCVASATKSSTLAKYADTYIQQVVTIVRPLTESIWRQKENHNEDCSDYTTYQLE